MINYIFGIFIIIGVIYSIITGRVNIINTTLLSAGEKSLEVIIKMIPLLCLWLGIMNIAQKSGLIKKISRKMTKFIKPIFPELSSESPAISYITTNIIMNLLGISNAATPFGLKAMKSLYLDNNKKDTLSRSMITFLVINTASITIIPTTVISFRILNNSTNPTDIVIPGLITSILTFIFALIIDRLFYKIWSITYE